MENENNQNGLTYQFEDLDYSISAPDETEMVELTITVPKIEPKKLKALKRLQKQQEDFQRKLGAEIDKRIIDYTNELHQKHPEMAGRTLQEIGIQPYIVMGNGFYNIEFKPL
jgi:hypothetical protein